MRPVILLGEGARGADMGKVMSRNIPVLTTWQAADLVDNNSPYYFGRPGLYGQRLANKVLYHCDWLIVIGSRLSVWTVGYGEYAPSARLTMVDIDKNELKRVQKAGDKAIFMDAKQYIAEHLSVNWAIDPWLDQCEKWRKSLPWIESPTHNDPIGHIHSHRFVDKLQEYFLSDEIIVTDMGTAMVAAYQVLRLKPPQRLLTSGGLGEMGVALPAAIGASFATNKGRVICLHCDGGIMLNLQELQTIIHHQLPVKIIVFDNRGYEMIKGTQRNLKLATIGVDAASGVSFPNFRQLAHAWGFPACDVTSWEEFDRSIPAMMATDGPSLIVYKMDENQRCLPKIQPILNEDGTISPPKFDELTPML